MRDLYMNDLCDECVVCGEEEEAEQEAETEAEAEAGG